MTDIFNNPPTVVVMLVETKSGLLMVRRGLSDGYGKLALPGGHQEQGEIWQEAGAREVLEETGAKIDPSRIQLLDLITVPSGINLVFAELIGLADDFTPKTDQETLEVLSITQPVETAFPTHTAAVAKFFEKNWHYGLRP